MCLVSRWTTIGWPHKIELQSEQTERQLEEDEERFHKLQLSDQASFNDKLDTLSMVVAGMAAHTDINRAHEVANEVRRLAKQMKEAQGMAQTYNNRERLFGMPITNVSLSVTGGLHVGDRAHMMPITNVSLSVTGGYGGGTGHT